MIPKVYLLIHLNVYSIMCAIEIDNYCLVDPAQPVNTINMTQSFIALNAQCDLSYSQSYAIQLTIGQLRNWSNSDEWLANGHREDGWLAYGCAGGYEPSPMGWPLYSCNRSNETQGKWVYLGGDCIRITSITNFGMWGLLEYVGFVRTCAVLL